MEVIVGRPFPLCWLGPFTPRRTTLRTT
jgi:hypothetical protein